MKKEYIVEKIAPAVASVGCFLVDVTVSADNDVEIVIEKAEGSVDWDDCSAVDKSFHELFDQDVEDYAPRGNAHGSGRRVRDPRLFGS